MPAGFQWPNWGEADESDDETARGTSISKKGLPVMRNAQHQPSESSESPVLPSRRRPRKASTSESEGSGSDDENDSDEEEDEERDDEGDDSDPSEDHSTLTHDSDELEYLHPVEVISNAPLAYSNEKFEKVLYDFMEKRGTPILKPPVLGKSPFFHFFPSFLLDLRVIEEVGFGDREDSSFVFVFSPFCH